jgi:hypothetical protein
MVCVRACGDYDDNDVDCDDAWGFMHLCAVHLTASDAVAGTRIGNVGVVLQERSDNRPPLVYVAAL